jgi:hypothetical protein
MIYKSLIARRHPPYLHARSVHGVHSRVVHPQKNLVFGSFNGSCSI